MIDNIPPQHLMNVFQVFLWNLAKTLYDMERVERIEDITAEKFLDRLAGHLERSQTDASTLGVDVTFPATFVDLVRRVLDEVPDHQEPGEANLRLVWPPPDPEDQSE